MNKKETLHFLDHHKKPIIQVCLLCLCFIIVAVGAKRGARKADPLYGARESFTESTGNNELNELISNYYKAYYNNDVSSLEEIVYPIGDLEKSYINFMSDYVEGCDIVEIYSKPGAKPNSYLVSVNANVKFKDVKEESPGLDFFYVSTDPQGHLYIDNSYTASIGGQDPEIDKDENVVALIEEFEEQEDVVMLRLSIQNEYNELIDSNDEFRDFVGETLPNALSQWYSDYNAELEATRAEEEAAAAAAAEAEAKAKAEEEAKAAAAAEAEAAAQAQAAAEAEAAAQAEAAAAAAAEAAAQIAEGGYPAGTDVTVNDILNIRMEPSTDSTKIGTVMRGATVKVVENSAANGWTKVDHNGKVGYIRTDVLR